MQVGDLVKALIVSSHPMGVITKVKHTARFGHVAYVRIEGMDVPWPLKAAQLEVISAVS
jgi:hypothetical protein